MTRCFCYLSVKFFRFMLQRKRANVYSMKMSSTDSMRSSLSLKPIASASRALLSPMVAEMELIILHPGQGGLEVME